VSTTKTLQSPSSALERAAYTIPEFCFRNHISRPAYHRLRATAEAERDWQRLMQEPNEALEQQAVARAVKAGDAAVKSNKHISKKTRRDRPRQSEINPVRASRGQRTNR
jgi:hypothetical protein